MLLWYAACFAMFGVALCQPATNNVVPVGPDPGIAAPKSIADLSDADIRRMVEAMEAGNAVDYAGLTAEQLNKLLTKINGTAMPTRTEFTEDQIRDMIRRIDLGENFNRLGESVVDPQPDGLTKVRLEQMLNQLLGTTDVVLTLADVRRMIVGMEVDQLRYNYQGQIAQPGEKTFDLAQLREFESQLNTTGVVETAEFTLADVYRMKNGSKNNNLVYNLMGQVAKAGDRNLTWAQLEQLEKELTALPPVNVAPAVGATGGAGSSVDAAAAAAENALNDLLGGRADSSVVSFGSTGTGGNDPAASGGFVTFGAGASDPNAAVDFGAGTSDPNAAVNFGAGSSDPNAAPDVGVGAGDPNAAVDFGAGTGNAAFTFGANGGNAASTSVDTGAVDINPVVISGNPGGNQGSATGTQGTSDGSDANAAIKVEPTLAVSGDPTMARSGTSGGGESIVDLNPVAAGTQTPGGIATSGGSATGGMNTGTGSTGTGSTGTGTGGSSQTGTGGQPSTINFGSRASNTGSGSMIGSNGFSGSVIDTSNFFTENKNFATGETFNGGPFTKDGGIIGTMGEEWRKARVDPAVCRAAACSGPICYLPYEKDCKYYVVCQRTAIGSYVAWKMRCAFGSYWREGSAWTCERVEDLLSTGYVCPNDPCRDGMLDRYADEDEKNCRTYWKCVNGVSTPVCCLAGQTFDRSRMMCVPDPEETCRSPCPLKIEGCSVPGELTQPFYDGNCRTYWNCQNGHPHPVCCKAGMFYNVTKRDCDVDNSGFCNDNCPPEYDANTCGVTVGNVNVTSYPLYDGYCRTFMKCNPGGYTEAFCCKQKYRYDVNVKACVPIEDPLDTCNDEICPIGYMEECRFSPVPGQPNKFQDKSINIVFDCAPGTYYDAPICTCNGNNKGAEGCNPRELWVKFDRPEDAWTIKNHGGSGSVSPYGNLKKNITEEGITYGTFNGGSGITAWPYTQTEFPEAIMRINFQPVSGGGDTQVLVSNCKSSSGQGPSYMAVLNPTTSEIEFRGVTGTDTAVLKVPYNKQGWNMLTLIFDGEKVLLMNEDSAGLGQAEKRVAPLNGNILASEKALRFGPCTEDTPADNGFTGFISEVVFSKCLDGRSREIFAETLSTMPAL